MGRPEASDATGVERLAIDHRHGPQGIGGGGLLAPGRSAVGGREHDAERIRSAFRRQIADRPAPASVEEADVPEIPDVAGNRPERPGRPAVVRGHEGRLAVGGHPDRPAVGAIGEDDPVQPGDRRRHRLGRPHHAAVAGRQHVPTGSVGRSLSRRAPDGPAVAVVDEGHRAEAAGEVGGQRGGQPVVAAIRGAEGDRVLAAAAGGPASGAVRGDAVDAAGPCHGVGLQAGRRPRLPAVATPLQRRVGASGPSVAVRAAKEGERVDRRGRGAGQRDGGAGRGRRRRGRLRGLRGDRGRLGRGRRRR